MLEKLLLNCCLKSTFLHQPKQTTVKTNEPSSLLINRCTSWLSPELIRIHTHFMTPVRAAVQPAPCHNKPDEWSMAVQKTKPQHFACAV